MLARRIHPNHREHPHYVLPTMLFSILVLALSSVTIAIYLFAVTR
jgi:hypothetical protein